MIGDERQVGKSSKDGGDGQNNLAPSISLPKGGGAIRGMGEKFAANPVTGTGSMTVPIATSPGRSGFGPQLALSYDSGAGNGPFGFGWGLSLPSITRKTEKGLPQYRDVEESDIFILSGAEDLVPVIQEDGTRFRDDTTAPGYIIHRYRPRIEGLFARIERWRRQSDGDVYWRSISKDNITTFYGKTKESRIANPEDTSHIFSWLICQSYDDKGNAIVYEYQEENADGIDLSQAHEKNRTTEGRGANRYLKRVKYGNRTPNRNADWNASDPAELGDWMFEVVFDYGEGHYVEFSPDAEERIFVQAQINPPDESRWPIRQDPFSSYHAGFEVRTYRLCQRVLMFHHFPNELGTLDYLVRSTQFEYSQSPIASFITDVRQSGYVRQTDETYLEKSLPPLSFEYSKAVINDEIETLDAESLQNLPAGADGLNYQWLDLDGEGLQGLLSEQEEGWYYKRNLSPISTVKENGKEKVVARFEPLTEVVSQPSIAEGAAVRHQFLDLAGDGNLDLVQFERPVSGFFERMDDERWESFIPFESVPNLSWGDPNLRFVDLTGDGHADILITDDDALAWYPSLAEEGFGTVKRIPMPRDEEKGPAVVFADEMQTIYVADLSGDGLGDIVRIRNGEVCYWPNLGYGRFGAKVTMDNAPWFDTPDQFDQKRIRLADIDGSGTTDIIYLERKQVAIYRNECGNGWSSAEYLTSFPAVDELSTVIVVDLLGNGTACLVWSSPLPGNALSPMHYIDLMGGQKPHLLLRTINNLGAETIVQYAPSTKFYLEDKYAGKPWITRLPFPVHVVERVEACDLISRNRFVTRYAYHHGYYDGEEREFRGFGMVEQKDTEELAALTESGDFPNAVNIDAASYVPTVLTKTWFHTGAYIEGERISRHFEDDYYHEGDESEGLSGLTDLQLEEMLLPDTEIPTTLKQRDGTSIPWQLTADETRDACRALKGAVLRREIFALDGTDEEDRPYSATEQNYTIELLQPQGNNNHAVFFAHPRESIDFHYERKLLDVAGKKLADPRVTHAMTLEVDGYANVLRSLAIGYRRRDLPNVDAPEQKQTHLTLTVNRFANRPDEQDWYRIGLPVETRTYEIVKPPEPTIADTRIDLFRLEAIAALTVGIFPSELLEPDAAKLWPYEKWDGHRNAANAPPDIRLRLIEHVRTVYRRDDLTDPLTLGEVDSLALPFESYKLAFTSGLLTGVYGAKVTDTMLLNDGRYVHSQGDNQWWIPSGRLFFDVNADIANPAITAPHELVEARAHFFLPRKFADPFNQSTTADYDAHDLTVVKTQDAMGNSVATQIDYRVLQPALMTDPNGNRAEVAFDALGLVAGTAVMGKASENLGDLRDASFEPDLTQAQLDAFMAKPRESSANPNESVATQIVHDLLGKATTRIVYDLDRFKRLGEPAFAATLARETHFHDPGGAQTKIQIGFSYSDGFGREIQKKIQAEPGPVVEGGPIVNPRWVGSGWTIFNNKGKPVRQYEPFFDDTHGFKFGVAVGVSPVLFYDPVERVVATLHPNHTYEKVVFDPWQQTTYDVNDTVTFDPKTDEDVKEFFTRLPDIDYLPTWHALRTDSSFASAFAERYPDATDRANETSAAQKTAIHADTPTVAHFDTLGRAFLTVIHNKIKYSNTPPGDPPIEEFHHTRVIVDIEGNQREVIDANGRIVMRYDYDMLGTRIYQASMEAGDRWMLNDVAGKPNYAWDSRNHQFHTIYDPLRRPTDSFLREGAGPDRLIGRTVYGESRPNPELNNQCGKVVQLFDQAGVVTTDEYDFKGNLRRSSRTVADDYKKIYDWNNDTINASWEIFHSSTTYDALNRPIQLIAPHGDQVGATVNIIEPIYNEATLLEQVHVWLDENTEPTAWLDPNTANLHAVANINYDAKGQRELIEYGNGVSTSYEYDPDTFRLANLKTTRLTDRARLQDLSYTYDPAGNITHIQDNAQQTIYFNNQVVTPDNDYVYDAIYRLINAEGREHIGQVLQPETTWSDEFRVKLQHPQNGQAMRSYTEQYHYDPVGNFEQVIHVAASGNWTRSYAYNEASLLEPLNKSNRLSSTTVGANSPETYTHDAHGNITFMPHLPLMEWDFRDQLQATARQVVNDGTPETTYYVYDAAGQRVRKVTERQAAAGQIPARKNERIYLGGFEIYAEYENDGETITLERETLHVMDDKQRIALVETRTLDAAENDQAPRQLIRYQFGNHLGSASLELNEQAQIISYEEYAPYGSSTYQAVRSQTETAKRYRYTGMERDEESGMYYHIARYYAPWIARWTSRDPVGLRAGVNLFVYANNSPLRFVDTTGMTPTIPKAGLPVASLGKGLQLLDQLNTAEGPWGTNEWFLGESGGKYRVFELEGKLGGISPKGYTAVAHTHPSGAMITAEDVATTTAHGVKIGGVRTHLVSRGNNRWAVIEVPTKGPATLTELDLNAGQVSTIMELERVGVGSTGTPHIPGTDRTLNQPSPIKTTSDLAQAMESSEPLGNAIPKSSLGWQLLGKGVMILGSLLGGLEIGGGITKIRRGQTAEGVVDITEGTTNVGLTIGTYAGVKGGAITVAEGTGVATFGAGLVAAASLLFGFEESRRAARGEKTMTEGAMDYWQKVKDDQLKDVEKEGRSVRGALKYVGASFGRAGAGAIYYPRRGIVRALEFFFGD